MNKKNDQKPTKKTIKKRQKMTKTQLKTDQKPTTKRPKHNQKPLNSWKLSTIFRLHEVLGPKKNYPLYSDYMKY